MDRNITLQFISAGVLAIIGFFLINPLHVWMPTMAHQAMLAAAIVVFGTLAVFVFSEGSGDERDDVHRAFAGRAAFLSGGVLLIGGIIVEGLHGVPDPWLVYALIAMAAAKVGARLYAEQYR